MIDIQKLPLLRDPFPKSTFLPIVEVWLAPARIDGGLYAWLVD